MIVHLPSDQPTDRHPEQHAITEEALIVVVRKGIDAMREFMGREPTNQEIDKMLAAMSKAFCGYRLIEGRRTVIPGEPIH